MAFTKFFQTKHEKPKMIDYITDNNTALLQTISLQWSNFIQ